MSLWTDIHGIITVEPLGITQPEKKYILDTVLAHLPKVTGSEEDMHTYVIQSEIYNQTNSSVDEFGQWSNLGNGHRWHGHADFVTHDTYIIVVDASLRDRDFHTAFKEFQKWLCRLSKRVIVKKVFVEVSGYKKFAIIRNLNDAYREMFEEPSWWNENGEPTWSEYMLYEREKYSEYPMLLKYKYFADKENDEEVERRLNYRKTE